MISAEKKVFIPYSRTSSQGIPYRKINVGWSVLIRFGNIVASTKASHS
jgi:hypothetical protein